MHLHTFLYSYTHKHMSHNDLHTHKGKHTVLTLSVSLSGSIFCLFFSLHSFPHFSFLSFPILHLLFLLILSNRLIHGSSADIRYSGYFQGTLTSCEWWWSSRQEASRHKPVSFCKMDGVQDQGNVIKRQTGPYIINTTFSHVSVFRSLHVHLGKTQNI